MKGLPRNSRKLWVVLVCFIALSGVLIARRVNISSFRNESLSFSASSTKSVQNEKLRVAPDFALFDANGNSHRLEQLRGKWIVLHFWASWCPPCRDEIVDWVELGAKFEKLKDSPFQWVAISLDPNWEEAHKTLPSERLPPFVMSLLDNSGKVPDLYGTYQFPETYLVNPDLKIVTKWVGPQNWKDPKVEHFFKSFL